ncbi:MAG: hypothetical protein ABIC40_02125 [bacterium]
MCSIQDGSIPNFKRHQFGLSDSGYGNRLPYVEISVYLVDTDTGILSLFFAKEAIPLDWYIEIPKILSEIGIKRIELSALCEFLGSPGEFFKLFQDQGPRVDAFVKVTDHIACHLPNPLTGTPDAQRGKAFVNMRGAYESEFQTPGNRDLDDRTDHILPGVVIWHSRYDRDLSAEEIDYLRKEGFFFVSQYIAPWAVGAKAAGCEFAAVGVVDFREE